MGSHSGIVVRTRSLGVVCHVCFCVWVPLGSARALACVCVYVCVCVCARACAHARIYLWAMSSPISWESLQVS